MINDVSTMKYTSLSGSVSSRFNRKIIRSASKRSTEHHRRSEDSDPSELSNDSGLGLDHQLEVQLATRTNIPYSTNSKVWCSEEPEVKRKKLTFQFEPDEINDDFCFPEILTRKSVSESNSEPRSSSPKEKISAMPGRGRGIGGAPITLSTPLSSTSRDGKAQLMIVCQPEQQHRARYQTEGSRGAVKDRTGNGFPVVKLAGYSKPTTLQIFIGTDVGRVTPHMFYQACRVSGKNSTPCVERKVDGTVVIEVDLDPSKDMVITCDCVGILKERNVDVEHRFPDQTGTRNKKKSTRCRMVFRTAITNSDGTVEVLQVCSQPIVCTQPPGVPEICKKSLTSCPVTGGAELFILGKNFLKDTKVIFQQPDIHPPWEETVLPDKEFLQQTHLVCVVPPYRSLEIIEPITVKIFITSSGKASDPHTLVYLPAGSPLVPSLAEAAPCSSYLPTPLPQAFVNGNRVFAKASNIPPNLPSSALLMKPPTMKQSYFDGIKKDVHSIPMMWPPPTKPEATDEEDKMMPPPPALIPISRRSSVPLMISDGETELKTEMIDEVSQHSVVEHDQDSLSPTDMQGVDLSMKTPMLRHLVDIPPVSIGSLSVEKYFSKGDASKSSYSVYETEQQRQYLEEDLLHQPPKKIQSREFSENSDMPVSGYPRTQTTPGSSVIQSGVAINESSQSGFEANPRGRSESFSENPSITETSVSDYDTYSRVRTSSISQSYGQSPSFESRSTVMRVYDSEPSPMVLSNDCSIDNAMSSVVKHAVREMQPIFYCQAPTPATNSITQVSSNSTGLDSLVCPELIASTSQTRSLDAFVNCAADSHISPKREPYLQQNSDLPATTHQEQSTRQSEPYVGRYHGMTSADGVITVTSNVSMNGSHSPGKNMMMNQAPFEALVATQMLSTPGGPSAQGLGSLLGVHDASPSTKNSASFKPEESNARSEGSFMSKTEKPSDSMKSSTVPLSVKEISEGAQKIGDMVVPPGPAPPITGMVPQEMVKMTDNDLISYINPSCFDQGY
ncbi:UNVERIFIED_CONTAM: hypothetical protein PYX00_006408 [Menopon gallinae]|uniref:Nuclear factor of activated T-cells 5 n=1 Tax=Menopon gallinae TaxID=328185 RepID=A0AAW2HWM1_9NEOP